MHGKYSGQKDGSRFKSGKGLSNLKTGEAGRRKEPSSRKGHRSGGGAGNPWGMQGLRARKRLEKKRDSLDGKGKKKKISHAKRTGGIGLSNQ